MTAINVVVADEAVHVFTDGVATAGAERRYLSKVFPIPHLSAVVATRGPSRLLGLAAIMLSDRASTFDDLVGSLRDFRSLCSQMREPWQVDTLLQPFEIVVAGIGRVGPAAYIIGNTDRGGIVPWEVVQIPFCLTTPQIDPADYARLVAADDPIALMPGVVKAQTAAYPALVGGFVQHTSVTCQGISTKILLDLR